MGFDPHALQLLLNVVVITGVTSLTLLWYLRRRDHLRLRREDPPASTARTEPAVQGHATTECAPVVCDSAKGDQDIRQYVARRSPEWSPRSMA